MADFRDQLRDRSGSLTDSQLRDPALFIRAQQKQQGKRLEKGPDNSFLAMGTLLLAGIGGWAMVRQFPKARLASLADEVKTFFSNPSKFGISDSVLPKLHQAMDNVSNVVARQPWAHVHKDKFGKFLGSAQVANDPEVQRALRILVETAEKNPKNFAHVMSVQKTPVAKLLAPIPQDTSRMRSLTIGDLFDPKGAWRGADFGAMPESYQNIQTSLQRFGSIKGMDTSATGVLHKIKVDPGVYIKRSTNGAQDLVNLRSTSPSHWLNWVGEQAKVARSMPFTRQLQTGKIAARMADWTAKLMVPTDMLGGQTLGSVSAEAVRAAMPKMGRSKGLKGGLFVGGKLFPRFDKGLGHGQKGFILGRSSSGTAEAARARQRVTIQQAADKRLKSMGLSPRGLSHLHTDDLNKVLDIEGTRRSVDDQIYKLRQSQPTTGSWDRAASGRFHMLRGRSQNLRQEQAQIGQKYGGLRIQPQSVGGGPTGATARYLHEQGINPESIKGLAIQAGGKLGIGPQFRLGQQAAGEIGESGMAALSSSLAPERPIPLRILDVLRGKDTITKQIQETFSFIKGKEAQEAGSYITTRRQAGADFFNYLIGRVGRLFEETTGMGLKPTRTPLGGMARWVGVGLTASAAWQGAQYVDYHSRNLTGTGPTSLPLEAYAATRVGAQAALEGVGIPQTADYLENLLPGSIDSPLSRGARTIGLTRLLTRRMASKGPIGAALAVALGATQLTDLGQSSANLAAVYRGDVEVPVREARFWSLGSQPFTGGRILYTRPHLIPTTLSRAGTIGRYGSESERWKQSFLPTPESFFGLRPFTDPYRLERQTYETRPYPLTAPMFQDVPFIGPVLSATVGEIFKPTRRMHPEYWQDGEIFEPQGIPSQGPPGSAGALGFTPISGMPRQTVGDPTRALTILGKQIDIIKNFLGMPGFLAGAMKHQLTGDSSFFVNKREVATAGRITSAGRELYDLELGGLMGMTEMLRRFVSHRNRATELVNPIINRMPDWMPGSNSAFLEDRQNRRDFHRGDPFAQIRMGEGRLPGPAYEALHRLHSGVPGVYDAYDKWKILKDVAPTSQAFQHYDTLVRSWALGSAISNKSGAKAFEQALGGQKLRTVVEHVIDGDTIVVKADGRMHNVRIVGGDAPEIAHSAFEASLPDTVAGNLAKARLERHLAGREVEITLEDVNLPEGGYKKGRLVGRITSLGWGGRDISTELEAAHPAYNLSVAQQAMVFNNRQNIERRFQPYPFTHRIFSDPFGHVPRKMRDLTHQSLGEINRSILREGEFSMGEKIVGNLWERVSHISLPGPLNWPVNKLFAQRDPLEVYRMQTQGGMEFGDWNTPVKGFIQPWIHQTIGAMNPDYVQPRMQRQRVVQQGLDALSYVKYNRLEQHARAVDRPDLQAHFAGQKNRTITHAIMSGQQRFIRGALARTERGFWTSFQAEKDAGRQQQILSLVPEDVGIALRQTWGTEHWDDRVQQAEMVHDLMQHAPKDWSGWHPDVPMSAMKVKIAHNEGWDIHDFGFAHRDEYLAEDIFADYTPIDQPEITFSPDLRPSAYNSAARLRLESVSVRAEEGPGPPEIRLRMRRDKRKFFHNYERFSSPAVMGSKF